MSAEPIFGDAGPPEWQDDPVVLADVYDYLDQVRPGWGAPGAHPAPRPTLDGKGAGAPLRPDVVGTQGGAHLPRSVASRGFPVEAGLDLDQPLRAADAAQFAAVDEASAEPLLATADGGVVLAAGGSVVFYGDGGAGKTTSGLDRAFHYCAGIPWCGLTVARACRLLWIENEGPRGMFRLKLRAKLEAWDGPPLEGRLYVLEQPWARFTFGNVQHRAGLAKLIRDLEIDIVVAGPVARLGVIGGGTPAEITAFVDLLELVRVDLERPLAYELLHHENKAGDVSGAWEGVTDTVAHVQARGNGHTAIVWRKVRWGGDLQGKTWKLDWLPGERYEPDETPEATEEDIEERLLGVVREAPGKSWNSYYVLLEGKNQTRRAVRDRLLGEGRLVNVGTAKAMRLFLPDQVDEAEQTTMDEDS